MDIISFTIQAHAISVRDKYKVMNNMSIGRKIEKLKKFYDNEKATIQNEIILSKGLIQSLCDDYSKNIMDEYEYRLLNQKFTSEIENLETKQESLDKIIEDIDSYKSKFDNLINDFLNQKEFRSLSRTMIVSLISKIEVSENKNIKIIFKYEDLIENINSIFAKTITS